MLKHLKSDNKTVLLKNIKKIDIGEKLLRVC